MKRILYLLFTLASLHVSGDLLAQDIVRGRVMDVELDEPVPGATVVELDANDRVVKGTITDFNGNYAIQISSPEARLQFSFIGYKNITESVAGRTTIDISFTSSAIAMDEVVVVAQVRDPLTGINERDRATSTVKMDMTEISKLSVTSAADALQGQISGLDIVSGGAPGSGSSIVIRGLGSLGDSRPLIVVDGIAQDVSSGSNFDFGSADVEDLGALVSIAPQDIKSIEVLKDAASTAVWGSQGADGVLMITTNRGTKGKTKFDFNYKLTLNQTPPAIPMLSGDEYSMLMIEEMHNAYGIFEIPPEISYDPDYVDFYNYSQNTDWVDEITQLGAVNDFFFKLSGGGDKTLYYVSLNASDETGTTVNEGFKRLTTRINLDYNLSRKVRFSVNFDYTNSYQDGNWRFNNVNLGNTYVRELNARRMAYAKAPNMSVWEYDSYGNKTGEYFTPIESFQGNGAIYFNPVAVANLSNWDVALNKFQNSFVLRYNVVDWFSLKQTVSYQYESGKRSSFLPYSAIGTDWLAGQVNQTGENNYNSSKISSQTMLIFIPIVNEVHELSGRLMLQLDQYNSSWAMLSTRNGPSTSVVDPSVGAPINWIGSGSEVKRALGSMVAVNYKLKDRYIFSGIVRADANSKFGINNRWGIFPSLSAAWRFSEEPFLRSFKSFMEEGKIRFSYGQSGKQPNNAYDRHGIFNIPATNEYINSTVVVPTQIQLANLKWQTITSANLGIDLTMFKGRVFLTAEVYNKVTTDLLWPNYAIPSSSGFSTLKQYNGGSVQNRGWEAYTRVYVVRKEHLDIGVNFNISRNFNTFLTFPENFNNIRGEVVANGVYPRQANIGQPIGSFYGFKFLGVYSDEDATYARTAEGAVKLDSNGDPIPMTFRDGTLFMPGDAKFEDVNKDGVIDINDAQFLGDSNPEFIGGFGANMNYKGFSASFQFMFRTGFDIVNEIALDTEGMTSLNNQSKAVLNRWRRDGQGAGDEFILPRAVYNHPANNLGSDRFVEPGDFLRLNNVSVGYAFRNNNFTRRLNIDVIELSVNFRKLLTFTRYSGQDPEISQRMEDPFWFGTDNGLTPTPRIYSFIFNIRF